VAGKPIEMGQYVEERTGNFRNEYSNVQSTRPRTSGLRVPESVPPNHDKPRYSIVRRAVANLPYIF
jgi:hypothetical protein